MRPAWRYFLALGAYGGQAAESAANRTSCCVYKCPRTESLQHLTRLLTRDFGPSQIEFSTDASRNAESCSGHTQFF